MRKRGKSFTRHVDPLAAFRSAGRQHPLDEDQKTHLAVVLRVHLQALSTGLADSQAFHHLANGVNVSMVMAQHIGIGFEHDDLIGGAQVAMRKLKANGKDKGRWLLDGANLYAMKEWLSVFEAQLGAASQQEVMNALDEVHRRIARGQIFEEQLEPA